MSKPFAFATLAFLAAAASATAQSEKPAFPHGMSLWVAAGYGAPYGQVNSLPDNVEFPDTDADVLYKGGPAFGAGLVLYNDYWIFELNAESRAFGMLTDQGKQLARLAHGFRDPDVRYIATEISAGRWFPLGRSAMAFATVGNGVIFQRVGEKGTYFHDNQYGLSLRAGVGWIPTGRRLIVRPYVRYQLITNTIPNDLSFLLGVGVALGQGD